MAKGTAEVFRAGADTALGVCQYDLPNKKISVTPPLTTRALYKISMSSGKSSDTLQLHLEDDTWVDFHMRTPEGTSIY